MDKIYKYAIFLIFSTILSFISIDLTPQKLKILFQDDFKSGKSWNFHKGDWAINDAGLNQKDLNEWNTNCFTVLKQAGTLHYEWDVRMTKGILDSGLHIFSSEGGMSERGNSYLIWQFMDGFVIYKTIRNRLVEKTRFKSKTVGKALYKNRVKYNPNLGRITIWQNNRFIGYWIDKKPIMKGEYISLRTNKTASVFSRIRVYTHIKQK